VSYVGKNESIKWLSVYSSKGNDERLLTALVEHLVRVELFVSVVSYGRAGYMSERRDER
jgi:hypothetical protein